MYSSLPYLLYLPVHSTEKYGENARHCFLKLNFSNTPSKKHRKKIQFFVLLSRSLISKTNIQFIKSTVLSILLGHKTHCSKKNSSLKRKEKSSLKEVMLKGVCTMTFQVRPSNQSRLLSKIYSRFKRGRGNVSYISFRNAAGLFVSCNKCSYVP